MGFLLIGGVLAFGFYFVSKQKTDTQIALSGNAPADTRILGSNDIGLSPPTQPSTVRPGPSNVRPPAQILGLIAPAPPSNLFTVVPQPPTNTVQVSPAFPPKLSNLFPPSKTVVAPASLFGAVSAKQTPTITEIKPLPFSPPKATQPTPMNLPKTGGLNSSTVKAPALPASLSKGLVGMFNTGSITTGKSRFL